MFVASPTDNHHFVGDRLGKTIDWESHQSYIIGSSVFHKTTATDVAAEKAGGAPYVEAALVQVTATCRWEIRIHNC